MWWSSIGLPVTDSTRSRGLDASSKITGPDMELCSAHINSRACIRSTIHLAPWSVVPVYEINRFLRLGRPLAMISIPGSPTRLPLMSRLCRKSRLLTMILHEREVRKLFLTSNSFSFRKQLMLGTSLIRSSSLRFLLLNSAALLCWVSLMFFHS